MGNLDCDKEHDRVNARQRSPDVSIVCSGRGKAIKKHQVSYNDTADVRSSSRVHMHMIKASAAVLVLAFRELVPETWVLL